VEEDSQLGFEFPGLVRRKIEANFAGGQVSIDGGVMLLRQVDRCLGFTKELDRICLMFIVGNRRRATKLLDFLEDLRLRYPENPSRAESSTYRWA
jgi:hypothetical protein